MDKAFRYISIGSLIIITVLAVLLENAISSKKKAEEKWKNAIENNKAYDGLLSSSEEKDIAFKFTVERLKYSKDSIFRELENTRKELKVKDSKLKSLQYISSGFSKSDTIILADTVFRDVQVDVDTLLSDEWYSLRLGLKYPSVVTVHPEFKSVKNIVVSAKKETAEPPKKFFLLRWFQKKHWVLNVDVIEKSPYVKDQKSRYVEILR